MEARFAPGVNEQGRNIADILRDRARRSLAERGWERVGGPQKPRAVDSGYRPRPLPKQYGAAGSGDAQPIAERSYESSRKTNLST